MAAFLDGCRFNATAGGTADWTYSSPVPGYQSPAAAHVVNGRLYKYRAESADLSQWELGEGAYNTATGVLARATVLFNSSGTTSAINFSSAPQVAIVALREDLISIEEANGFSTAQKKQAQANILVAPTMTVLSIGSGTYATPTGCTRIRVRMVGGGGGGSGSGTSGGGTGGSGGNTTFGSSLLLANGGPGGGYGGDQALGGTASLGTGPIGVALQGGAGQAGGQGGCPGGQGASSALGGNGAGALYTHAGQAAAANTGGGGGGGGGSSTVVSGNGGSAGGFVDAIINSPAASYSYAVGAGGAGAAAGASGLTGGAGGSGGIWIEEYYGS